MSPSIIKKSNSTDSIKTVDSNDNVVSDCGISDSECSSSSLGTESKSDRGSITVADIHDGISDYSGSRASIQSLGSCASGQSGSKGININMFDRFQGGRLTTMISDLQSNEKQKTAEVEVEEHTQQTKKRLSCQSQCSSSSGSTSNPCQNQIEQGMETGNFDVPEVNQSLEQMTFPQPQKIQNPAATANTNSRSKQQATSVSKPKDVDTKGNKDANSTNKKNIAKVIAVVVGIILVGTVFALSLYCCGCICTGQTSQNTTTSIDVDAGQSRTTTTLEADRPTESTDSSDEQVQEALANLNDEETSEDTKNGQSRDKRNEEQQSTNQEIGAKSTYAKTKRKTQKKDKRQQKSQKTGSRKQEQNKSKQQSNSKQANGRKGVKQAHKKTNGAQPQAQPQNSKLKVQGKTKSKTVPVPRLPRTAAKLEQAQGDNNKQNRHKNKKQKQSQNAKNKKTKHNKLKEQNNKSKSSESEQIANQNKESSKKHKQMEQSGIIAKKQDISKKLEADIAKSKSNSNASSDQSETIPQTVLDTDTACIAIFGKKCDFDEVRKFIFIARQYTSYVNDVFLKIDYSEKELKKQLDQSLENNSNYSPCDFFNWYYNHAIGSIKVNDKLEDFIKSETDQEKKYRVETKGKEVKSLAKIHAKQDNGEVKFFVNEQPTDEQPKPIEENKYYSNGKEFYVNAFGGFKHIEQKNQFQDSTPLLYWIGFSVGNAQISKNYIQKNPKLHQVLLAAFKKVEANYKIRVYKLMNDYRRGDSIKKIEVLIEEKKKKGEYDNDLEWFKNVKFYFENAEKRKEGWRKKKKSYKSHKKFFGQFKMVEKWYKNNSKK